MRSEDARHLGLAKAAPNTALRRIVFTYGSRIGTGVRAVTGRVQRGGSMKHRKNDRSAGETTTQNAAAGGEGAPFSTGPLPLRRLARRLNDLVNDFDFTAALDVMDGQILKRFGAKRYERALAGCYVDAGLARASVDEDADVVAAALDTHKGAEIASCYPELSALEGVGLSNLTIFASELWAYCDVRSAFDPRLIERYPSWRTRSEELRSALAVAASALVRRGDKVKARQLRRLARNIFTDTAALVPNEPAEECPF
jgi:hypothetical protein